MNANSKWCQWPIRESRFSFAPNLFRWWQEFQPIHRVKLSKSSPITQLVILTSLESFLPSGFAVYLQYPRNSLRLVPEENKWENLTKFCLPDTSLNAEVLLRLFCVLMFTNFL